MHSADRGVIRGEALPRTETMTSDPFEAFKASQREVWKSFAPLAQSTTPSAARLVHFAGGRPGQTVLDVGGGTGVVAITARRAGGGVTGVDLTPGVLAVAKEDAAIAAMGDIVLQRRGSSVRDVTFDRGVQVTAALSPQHYRHQLEQSGGPMVRVLQTLKDDPARLAQFRREYDDIVSEYFDRNIVRQDFLETRATKV